MEQYEMRLNTIPAKAFQWDGPTKKAERQGLRRIPDKKDKDFILYMTIFIPDCFISFDAVGW